MRAEVADAGLHIQLAVRPDRHQTVVADRAGAMRANRHADAADLRSIPLAGACLAFVPLEELGAAIEGVLHERARDVATLATRRWPVEGLALRRVDPADRHLIEAEFFRGFRDDWFHNRVGLHRPRRALLRPRRRVRDDRHAPEAHRERLPDQRRRVGGRAVIAHRPVWSIVFDDEKIKSGDASVPTESHPGAADHAGPRSPDVVLLLAADAHHHRRIGFFREQGGDGHRDGPAALAAESTARVLADQDNLRRVDPDPVGDGIDGPRHALRRSMKVQLAVLPVGHRRSGFHRLVSGGLHDEGFVHDQRRITESGVEVAVRPRFRRLACRQLAPEFGGEVRIGPLERFDLGTPRLSGRAGSGRWRWVPHIAFEATICAAGPKALDRVDDKWQRLEIQIDSLDRLGSGDLVHGGEGKNRFALIQRLVGQGALGAAVRSWKIVSGENRLDAGHGHRRGRVDSAHPGVRHWTQKQLAEQHAVRFVVLGVLRPSGDLGDEIRCGVVLADELVVRHVRSSVFCPKPVFHRCQTPI
jgi:hypothetical protein